MKTALCPVCGAQMKSWGRGATRRKHGQRWVCPVAQKEVVADERGHLKRVAGAQHATTRIWTDEEIGLRVGVESYGAAGRWPGCAVKVDLFDFGIGHGLVDITY